MAGQQKPWEKYASGAAPITAGQVFALPPDLQQQTNTARTQQEIGLTAATMEAQVAKSRADAARSQFDAETQGQQQAFERAKGLRNDYLSLPSVKAYTAALPVYASGLKSKSNPAGDQDLIYAYAKIMDPNSVVREGEQASVANADSWFNATKARLQNQLDRSGQFTPQYRQELRQEMANRMGQLNQSFIADRVNFKENAQRNGVDPRDVVGEHPGQRFQSLSESVFQRPVRKMDFYGNLLPEAMTVPGTPAPTAPPSATTPPPTTAKVPGDQMASLLGSAYSKGAGVDRLNQLLAENGYPALDAEKARTVAAGGQINFAPPTGFQGSYLGQFMSGANKGLGNTLGAPVDLMTMLMNAVPGGINAIAGTNIPKIEHPFAGGDWWNDLLTRVGSISAPSDDPSRQFVRRMGESVGAAVVPIGATAGSARQAGMGLLSALAGGVGGATAQRVAPGNTIAEMASELAGSGLAGGAGLLSARRSAQRAIEAEVPTVAQLKDQAGELYRSAEARGVTAEPMQTQQLADNFTQALKADGRISPTGRISEVYPKAKEAAQLVNDYAGQTMTPTQMQTVRSVIADGAGSADSSERRTAKILLNQFDDWANPLAPELADARGVASRYLNAETLGRLRDLAGARAGQFTGSGFENALRTEYRGLDRAMIKGQEQLPDYLEGPIRDVSRGTAATNFARNVGKLAPTGIVSGALATGVPFAMGNAIGGPALGASLAGGAAGLGYVGRAAATRGSMRLADIADLIARNGGVLEQAPVLTDENRKIIAALLAGQQGNYLPK